MSIKICRYMFEGPYSSTKSLEDKSAVYVILCSTNSSYEPIDCGESATVKSRVENHGRKICWNSNCSGTLKVAVLYTPNLQSSGRITIEQEIRAAFRFPCGSR